jgi:hypothetical protein
MIIQGQVGPQSGNTSLGAGTNPSIRQGQLGELVVSELHGFYYEQTYRGNLFSTGQTAPAALTSTNSTGTLTASCTPILGLWNPINNTNNVVLLKANLQIMANSLTSGAAPGAFVWAVSVNNSAITTGSTPWNRKSLTQQGSQVRTFNSTTALTGLTNNLVVMETADFNTMGAVTYTTLASTTLQPSVGGIQLFEGGLIVPPGGVIALLNTTTATTFSVAGKLLWEEVPL